MTSFRQDPSPAELGGDPLPTPDPGEPADDAGARFWAWVIGFVLVVALAGVGWEMLR